MYYKIKSPKSGKAIYIGGQAYYNLIKEGYKEEALNRLPKIKSNTVPKSPKIKPFELKTNISLLPDEIILEEILLNQKPEDFMSFCQSNVRLSLIHI